LENNKKGEKNEAGDSTGDDTYLNTWLQGVAENQVT